MTADLITFLRARYDEREQLARAATTEWTGRWQELTDQIANRSTDLDAVANHMEAYGPAWVLADIAAKRLILDEHAPEWRTVEWPHDQDGKGNAQACRRCQNAEHTHWNPPVGQAGVLPEGFITPYVLAPCRTVRLLASPFASHPDYRKEWKP